MNVLVIQCFEQRLGVECYGARPDPGFLVHVAGANLGLWMRTLIGVGTPRGLQGRLAAVMALCFTLWVLLRDGISARRPWDLI